MKFNSQICTTRVQSVRLLALGLKEETADIVIRPDNTLIVINENSFIYHNLEKATQEGYFPAWSLHRLLCLLPDKTPYSDGYLTVEVINENVYIVLVIEDVEQRVLKYTKGNLYDNLISCINFFVKESLFNKEYLE